jgi:hypothetical protein
MTGVANSWTRLLPKKRPKRPAGGADECRSPRPRDRHQNACGSNPAGWYWSATPNNKWNAWDSSSATGNRTTTTRTTARPCVVSVSARPELKPSFRTPLDYRVRLMTAGACLTIEAVFDAYFDCHRVKRGTINQLRFEADLESNLVSLYEDLASGRYPGHGSPCNVSRTSLCRHRCLPISDGRPMRRTSQRRRRRGRPGPRRNRIALFWARRFRALPFRRSARIAERPGTKGRQRPGLSRKGHAASARN